MVNNDDNLNTFRSDFLLNLYSLWGLELSMKGFFDMDVCFFTRPDMAVFIFCLIVIAYVLPSVSTLPVTPSFCIFKNQNPHKKLLVTLSLVHSCALPVLHSFCDGFYFIS